MRQNLTRLQDCAFERSRSRAQSVYLKMETLPKAPTSLKYGSVKIVFDQVTQGDKRRGFVPGYRFTIFNAREDEVGHLNFRVGTSEHVEKAAGHIGFEIFERYRGNRYAGDACLALAPWVAEVSVRVLITVDPGNQGSIRTIERLGADFLDEVAVPEGDPHWLRGSFRKLRYLWTP